MQLILQTPKSLNVNSEGKKKKKKKKDMELSGIMENYKTINRVSHYRYEQIVTAPGGPSTYKHV